MLGASQRSRHTVLGIVSWMSIYTDGIGKTYERSSSGADIGTEHEKKRGSRVVCGGKRLHSRAYFPKGFLSLTQPCFCLFRNLDVGDIAIVCSHPSAGLNICINNTQRPPFGDQIDSSAKRLRQNSESIHPATPDNSPKPMDQRDSIIASFKHVVPNSRTDNEPPCTIRVSPTQGD